MSGFRLRPLMAYGPTRFISHGPYAVQQVVGRYVTADFLYQGLHVPEEIWSGFYLLLTPILGDREHA